MSDELNITEKVNAPEEKLSSDFEKRRKLLLGAASVTPVLMTISTKPAWGATGGLCGISGNLSGNLSNSELIERCEYNILSPGGNGQISRGNWGPHIYAPNGITDIELTDNIWDLLGTGYTENVIADYGDKNPLEDMTEADADLFVRNMTIQEFFDLGNKTASWTCLRRAIQAMVNAKCWDALVAMYIDENTSDLSYLKFVNCGFYFPVPDEYGNPSYDMDMSDMFSIKSTAEWVETQFSQEGGYCFFADFIKDEFENMC